MILILLATFLTIIISQNIDCIFKNCVCFLDQVIYCQYSNITTEISQYCMLYNRNITIITENQYPIGNIIIISILIVSIIASIIILIWYNCLPFYFRMDTYYLPINNKYPILK